MTVPPPVFDTPYVVGHRAYRSDGEDAHGNDTETWDAPTPRKVYGWGPPQTSEPKLAGQDRDVVEIELLVPPGFVCSPRDHIVLDGAPDPDTGEWVGAAVDPDTGEFVNEVEVIGRPEMADHNPFGWNPGGVVNLKRVNG